MPTSAPPLRRPPRRLHEPRSTPSSLKRSLTASVEAEALVIIRVREEPVNQLPGGTGKGAPIFLRSHVI